MGISLDKSTKFIIFGLLLFLIITGVKIGYNYDKISNTIYYREKVNAYSVVDGFTYRYNSENTFYLLNYEKNNTETNFGSFSAPTVTYTILNPSLRDEETFTVPIRDNNLIFNMEEENNTLKSLSFTVLLFRSNRTTLSPFEGDTQIRFITRYAVDRWNINSTEDYFGGNVGYYEYSTIDGKETKIKVNTEMTTVSIPSSGRVVRSAIHIVKRDLDQRIIGEYNYVVYELTWGEKIQLSLDQPSLALEFVLFMMIASLIVVSKIINVIKEGRFKVKIEYRRKIEDDGKEDDSGDTDVES